MAKFDASYGHLDYRPQASRSQAMHMLCWSVIPLVICLVTTGLKKIYFKEVKYYFIVRFAWYDRKSVFVKECKNEIKNSHQDFSEV